MRISRRSFLGCAAGAALGAATARGAAARANIVFLFSDDHRFDTIAALGNNEIRTPNLDRLAARGTAFTQAAVMGGLHGAICVPSRAMLHTGRHLFHLDGPGDVLPAKYTSLPEALRGAGYRTYAIGKWHNDRAAFNRCYNEGGPIFFGGMHDHFKATMYDYDPSGAYPRDTARDYAGRHTTEVFANAAVDFLGGEQRAPFFLYVSFTAPHDPRTAPPEYLAMYDPANIALPPNFMPRHPFDNGELQNRDEQLAPWPRTPEEIRRQTAEYYASITYLDAQIGRILDMIDARGLTENTVIVFAGDNGLALGRHGLMGKQSLYEHSLRVPMLLAGPGVPAGERRDALCYIHDLAPTLCEATGTPAPATMEASSLWGCLEDPVRRVRERTFHAYRNLQRAVRDGKHKLIHYTVKGTERTQLFDLAADPWELNDLSEAQPALRDALMDALKAEQQRLEFS